MERSKTPSNQQELPLGTKQDRVHEQIQIPDLNPFYQLAYARAQEDTRISMKLFSNRKDLAEDMKMVQEKLQTIRATLLHGSEEEKMAIVQSDVFEHMLHRHIGEAHWFGENTKSILPSVYDDLFRGIDLILEQNLGRGAVSFSTLAIDATFSSQGALQKLERTRENLLKGKMGGIKYFKSESMNITGRMDNIPHFVLGIGRPALFEMTKEYVQKDARPGVNQGPRRMVLEQIIAQAKYYATLLHEQSFDSEAEKYERIKEEMEYILVRGDVQMKGKEVDEVHKVIMEYCVKRGSGPKKK